MTKGLTASLFSGVSLLMIATPAHAQSAPQESEARATDDIVVTAQKREQSIQDVPISIAVVTGEQVTAFHAKDMADLAATIPNVYVERLNAADVIYIRGFGSAPSNFSFDQSVSMYQDGIYAGRGKQFQAPFFDLERIEVLRGPQGALFGKNTPAGAISIVTANPTSTFEAGLTGVYNFDLRGGEVSGFISGPLSENFTARLAVKGLKQEGYVPNRTTGQNDPRRKQALARLTLRYESGPFDATLKGEFSESHTKGTGIVLANMTTGAVTEDRFADGTPFGEAEAENIISKNASLTMNYDLGEYTVTSVTGYSTYDADRSNSYTRDVPAVYLNRILETFEQASQEIRLSSPVGQTLEYIVGGYFDWSNYNLNYPKYYNLSGGRVGSITSKFNQSAKTYSAFVQATLNLADTFRLIGSARYTNTTKDGDFITIPLSGFQLGTVTTANGHINEGNVDPSLTAQFDASEDIMIYAAYGRGSKSGGFVSNTVGTVDSTFIYRPERSTNYEVGIKGSLFDRQVTFDLSAYHLQFKDLQTSVYDPTLVPPAFVTKNAASATSKGVEWSITGRPTPNLKLTWSGAYMDAKYDDFPGANCLAHQVGCTPATNNLAGVPLTFSSKWSGSVQAQHVLDIGDSYKLTTTGQMVYRSRFYIADNQDPIIGVQPTYQKFDLRLQFGDRDDKWNVALVGRNLTDERTYSFAFFWPGSLSNFPTGHKYLEETRTISIEGSVKF